MSAAFSPPVAAGFVSATAASAPRGSALAGWRRTLAAVGGFVHSRLTSWRSSREKRRASAAVRHSTTAVQTEIGFVASALAVLWKSAVAVPAAEAALAQLDAIAVAAAIVAVDRQEALDRGQRLRCGERGLHARNVALLQDARASGGCARCGD